MIGHFACGGASGGFGLSHEHACKLIRHRTLSEARRSANALPGAFLSPISRILRSHKTALRIDGRGWLVGGDDQLPLGFVEGG
jgi:hypothetical protein